MTERFQKAYNSLVRAFFEGTLAKFTCTACACGNIINDALGRPLTKEMLQEEMNWLKSNFYVSDNPEFDAVRERFAQARLDWAEKRHGGTGKFIAKDYYKDEVNAAGYTAEEFAAIENAFEDNTVIKISSYHSFNEQMILEDQYNGLCAVVDVLLELDKEFESKDDLKQKFREHPKLMTV